VRGGKGGKGVKATHCTLTLRTLSNTEDTVTKAPKIIKSRVTGKGLATFKCASGSQEKEVTKHQSTASGTRRGN